MKRVEFIARRIGGAWLRGGRPALAALLTMLTAEAHRPSDGWLQLTVTNRGITLQLDLALKDLEGVLGIDTSDDGKLTWGELRRHEPDLNDYVTRHLTLTNRVERLVLVPEPLCLVNHEEVMCASLLFTAEATAPLTELTLTYRCLFDLDPQHRAFVQAVWAGAVVAGVTAPNTNQPLSAASFTGLLSPAEPSVTFVAGPGPGGGHRRGGLQFFAEGVHHIGSGYDHLLFLAALLLPSVLVRRPAGWVPVATFPQALTVVLQVVTAFTLAHSLTLALAVLGMARPPSRLIESAIAASVLWAALRNLLPHFPGSKTETSPRWTAVVAMPFGFGLIHGFGFANALGELGLAGSAIVVPLVGFNLGVEAGQLAAVALFLPTAYAFRRSAAYRRGVLPVGSVLIALTAAAWLVDRVFDLGRMPF